LYSILYTICLWASIYFIHHDDMSHATFSWQGSELSIGIIFLAWVSTFRDLAQLSGLRFRSVMILVLTCLYLFTIFDGRVAYAAIAALFWTELLDFFIFTYFLRHFVKRPFHILLGVVVSDIVTIPALWFMILIFLGYPLTALPDGILSAQYIALLCLYLVLAPLFVPNDRWRRYLNVRKAS